jgi:hypothetical protein
LRYSLFVRQQRIDLSLPGGTSQSLIFNIADFRHVISTVAGKQDSGRSPGQATTGLASAGRLRFFSFFLFSRPGVFLHGAERELGGERPQSAENEREAGPEKLPSADSPGSRNEGLSLTKF